MIAISTFLFVSFIGYALHSQPLIPRFENLGVNDGFSHSSVYSIHQDKKGFMWFGTPNGLCRYDGNDFQTYQYHEKNKNSSFNNFVRGEILEDPTGNIWYSNENGIFKWDRILEKISWKWDRNLLENNTSEYRAILIDNNQQLWLFNIFSATITFY